MAWQVVNSLTEAVAEKIHNFGSDSLKILLSNTAPSVANTVKVDWTEIAAGNGYTAGGFAVTVTASSQSGGTYSLTVASSSVTASGGPIGPFRYLCLYNDTATNDEAVAFYDYGVSYTLPDGQPFTIAAHTVFQIVKQ